MNPFLLPPESSYAQDILAAQKETEHLAQTGMTGLDILAAPPPAEVKAASMAQPGDLEGTLAHVTVGATGVKIMIDQARS